MTFDFKNQVVFVNGLYSSKLSSVAENNLKIVDLKQQGVSITVQGILREPLHILYVCSETQSLTPKTTICVEKFGNAQIIELSRFEGDVQNPIHSETNMIVEESAELHHFSFSLGGTFTCHEVKVTLNGPHAFVSLDGLYIGKDKQRTEYQTVVHHAKPHAVSRQLYKGILNDEARAVFNGKIIVDEGAVFTDATQLNKNLLLSKKAQIDTQPQLEIANNDVKCTHGATVGQMNPEEIFYFESRGIPKKIATGMLLHGFVDDVLDRVTHAETRYNLGELLEERLFRDAA